MKSMSVDIPNDNLHKFRDEVSKLIDKHELNVLEVLIFSLFYSIEAADQLEATKEDYLRNADNFWDLNSKYSKKYEESGTQ